jgi:acetylornithine deacetylase/succinyl-diaminopimelate desuccinylase-like protein
MSTATAWQTYLNDNYDRHFALYLDFLRIPSISTDETRKPELVKAAGWVSDRLKEAGVPEVEVIPTPGHPVVFGNWHVGEGLPTLLVYGHYDVQPVEPLELWETPPFEPSIRDGIVYARASSDMKANLLTLVQAIEALAKTEGAPPVNLKLLFEGEEEIGSPNLPAVIRANRERFASDVALSADGGMSGPDKPSLTVALKGLVGCRINLRTSTTDLHSGGYGAAVPNAVQQLVQLAATFHDSEGRVAIEGFYDTVLPFTEEDEAELAAIPEDDEKFLKEAGVQTAWGEPGFSLLERRSARPTVDLNGLWGGFLGEGNKTVTPAEAHLNMTCRLVPNQQPEAILELIKAHVAKHTPAGIATEVIGIKGSAVPYSIDRSTPALQTAKAVLHEIYGVAPLLVRAGGSVPVTETFKTELGIDTVTIGFAMPGSRAHAPNEWFRVEDYAIAQKTFATFFKALASHK